MNYSHNGQGYTPALHKCESDENGAATWQVPPFHNRNGQSHQEERINCSDVVEKRHDEPW